MAKKNVTAKNYAKVLDNLKGYMQDLEKNKDKFSLKLMCGELNAFIDDLASNDAFGTEGQLDPRGDQRD